MKGSPPEDLLRAIRTVTAGKPFVDPSLSPALLMSQVGRTRRSEREREILQLLAEGLHTEEVARRIGLSTETVKSDTKRAILKLEADTRCTPWRSRCVRRSSSSRRRRGAAPLLDRDAGLIVIFVLIGMVIAIVKRAGGYEAGRAAAPPPARAWG